MKDSALYRNIVQNNIDRIHETIDCLYITSSSCEKNRLLNRLRKNIAELETLMRSMSTGAADGISQPEGQRNFTLSELAENDGKNGRPAYVAVNGTVYDVTNAASWAAATHFGLTAGRDVTKEFTACHAGQPVLQKLRVVGKMTG